MSRIKLSHGIAFLVVAVLAGVSGQAVWAAPPTNVAYSLTMSPSAEVLDALDDFGEGSAEFMTAWKHASWDDHHLRIRTRNKPALMLINDDDSEAPITSFSITINEGPYVFGSGDFITDNFTGFIRQNPFDTDAGVTITGSSLSLDEKTLNVTFDGLTAGRRVIFNLDIDPQVESDSVYPYPDYRLVLCGAPSLGDPGGNMPATVAATFTSTTMGPPDNTRTLPMILPKATMIPEYYERFIRSAKEMEMIDYKQVEIPEPGSVALALAAVGMASVAGRRRGG
jgi:hypothetical protein